MKTTTKLKNNTLLALDPSGNFNEGKGTTGWVLFNFNCDVLAFGQISAKDYMSREKYWDGILDLIRTYNPLILVVEDYLLYQNRAMNQVNSRFETPQLIGVIKMEAYKDNREIYLQQACEVKTRWTEARLINSGYMYKKGNRFYINGQHIPEHSRDALRHGIHFIRYKFKKRSKYDR